MKIDKYENQQMSATTFEVHHKKDKDFKTVEMHSHDFSEVYFFCKARQRTSSKTANTPCAPATCLLYRQTSSTNST